MKCDAKCLHTICGSTENTGLIKHIVQQYVTITTHNSWSLCPSRLKTHKSSQSWAKIALHHKNCEIVGKRQNCAKTVQRKIAIFWWD